MAKESAIIADNLEKHQFAEFSEKINRFEELTAMVDDALHTMGNKFEGEATDRFTPSPCALIPVVGGRTCSRGG